MAKSNGEYTDWEAKFVASQLGGHAAYGENRKWPEPQGHEERGLPHPAPRKEDKK